MDCFFDALVWLGLPCFSGVENPEIEAPPPHKLRKTMGTWVPVSGTVTPASTRIGTPATASSRPATAGPVLPPKPTLKPRGRNLGSIPPLLLPAPAQVSPSTSSSKVSVFAVVDIKYTNNPLNNPNFYTTKVLSAMASGTHNTPHNAGLSQSWISPAASNAARFMRLQTVASHLQLARSPFFPRTATEYGAHLADYASLQAAKQRRMLEKRIEDSSVRTRERKGEKGVGLGGEEAKVNGCELAYVFEGEKVVSEEEKRGEVGWHVAHSGVLGEKTNFWAGGEEALREGVVDEKNGMRAFWPDNSELKMEGEMRARKTHQRRFPLPRVDLYSSGMIKHFIPPSANLTPAEKNALINQIVTKKKVEDIAWHERQVVPFKHKLDRLPTLTKIWAQNEKTDNGRPYYTPPASECDDEGVGVIEDFAVRAGGAAEEYDAGDRFSSFGSADGDVFEGSYGYHGTIDGRIGGDNGESYNHNREIRGRTMGSHHGNGNTFNERPQWSQSRFGLDEQGHPVQDYGGIGGNEKQTAARMPNPYDGHGLPDGYSNGAEGPGNGKRPPPGGWIFDEEELKKNKDWADLLDELDCCVDDA